MEEISVPIFLSLFNEIELHFFNVEVILVLFFVLFLIVCSAFISGAEVAYFSLSANELEKLEGEAVGSDIVNLLKKANQLLATI